ncbi:hypothetical protein QJQ45_007724 [Haematococcus lacustris]|nr:hypothetical protein QJQ45_007724 [Haematococcus lacustris]
MHVGVLTPRACADAVVLPGWRSAVRATFLRKMQCRGLAVGIDLGTTSSVLAVVDEAGRPHILEDARGRLAIPSLVYLTEVSALLLSHLLDRAEKELAGPGAGAGLAASKLPASPRPRLIQQAVITVPAHFGPAQKQATLDAGRMAGLSKVSLLQEPVAAAMAYGFGSTASQHSSHHAKSQKEPGTHHSSARAGSYETLLVFDLGGGTFDVSLLEGWEGILEVLATDGDNELGGDDFTRALADQLLRSQTKAAGCAVQLADLPPHERLHWLQTAEATKLALTPPLAPAPLLDAWDRLPHPSPSLQPQTGSGSGHSMFHGFSGGMQSSALSSAWQTQNGNNGQPAAARQLAVSQAQAGAAWQPLVHALWPPLQRLAQRTRTQFAGRLPDAAQAGNSVSSSAPAPAAAAMPSSPALPGHHAWDYQMFSSNSAGGAVTATAAEAKGAAAAAAQASTKYVAQPRRPTGVVLVGAATRTPCVREFVTQAGVLSGAQGVSSAELTDGSYLASQHGRATEGWSSLDGQAGVAATQIDSVADLPEWVP